MSETPPDAALVAGLQVTAEATVIRGGRVIPPGEDERPDEDQEPGEVEQ